MTIKTALISVSDKTGIVEFAQSLNMMGVEILSTGGTAKLLRDADIKVRDVADLTRFPEIMDGRVKTLHPKVHGGILAIRDNAQHQEAVENHDIEYIDMVVINLYPFEETIANGAVGQNGHLQTGVLQTDVFQDAIENIDIGGPSMIRSAAKNHHDVTVVVDANNYAEIIQQMQENNNSTSPELRKKLAAQAFARTASYDTAISTWFATQTDQDFPERLNITAQCKQVLRYGENPHQKAALYVTGGVNGEVNIPSVANAIQLQGKELSYNNIADTDAAFELVSEFDKPAVAIIKHANPCGVAVASDNENDGDEDIVAIYKRALSCDPVSSYGGILAFNREFSADMAVELGKLFAEVIIAPKFDDKAKEILSRKKNLRLLETGSLLPRDISVNMVKSIAGGFLVQSRDNKNIDENNLKVVTKRQPTAQEMEDLLLAFTICKHVKSNAIIYVKDGATIGIGAGQMSRVDSARIGAWKAGNTCTSVDNIKGSVFASDAFLPFADGLLTAAEQGVTALIQPGGSIRDEEVIAAANEHNIAMVFTNIRHFKH